MFSVRAPPTRSFSFIARSFLLSLRRLNHREFVVRSIDARLNRNDVAAPPVLPAVRGIQHVDLCADLRAGHVALGEGALRC